MSDKEHHMLLLGAGASVEADIPAAYKMTEKILGLFDPESVNYKVLSFVLGGLLFDQGIKGANPLTTGVNIEDLFNAVDLLSRRSQLEASPFIGSWHSMVEEFDQIPPTSPQADKLHNIIFKSVMEEVAKALKASPPPFGTSDIDKKLEQLVNKGVNAAAHGRYSVSMTSSFDSVGREIQDYLKDLIDEWTHALQFSRVDTSSFEEAFSRAIDQQPKPANGAIFARVTDAMIRKLVDLVWIPSDASLSRVQHLAPILNLLDNQDKTFVTTLNYDNSIEFLAQGHGICWTSVIDDDLIHSVESSSEHAKGLVLLKLHGSIDWELSTPELPLRKALPARTAATAKMPLQSVHCINPAEKVKTGYRPAVIFGQKNKLTTEGPYLDLLRVFRDELEKTTVLSVVGYSFADSHVNEYISRWLNGHTPRRIRVVDPNFEDSKQPYVEALKHFKLAAPDRVEIITKEAGEALIELFGERLMQKSF